MPSCQDQYYIAEGQPTRALNRRSTPNKIGGVSTIRNNASRLAHKASPRRGHEKEMCGSRNHLRAIVRNINLQGEPYEPLYLDDDKYDEIITSSMERNCGNSNGAGNRKGKGPHPGQVQLN